MILHVLGHNFAPFEFLKVRLGHMIELLVPYIFAWDKNGEYGRYCEGELVMR